MNRKQFLLLTGLVATGAAGRWLLGASPVPPASTLRPRFLTSLFDDAELCRLGGEYRSRFPEEDSVRALASRLLGARSNGAGLGPGEVLARDLERQVQADFVALRIVQVDGWVLSVTEARQCALLSILSA